MNNPTTATHRLRIDGADIAIDTATLERYSRPTPRYTSYPTAPEWDDTFGPSQMLTAFAEADALYPTRPISLYVHLPYCHSLCLFCGCNVVISKDAGVVAPYLEILRREIATASGHVSRSRPVEQIHWGGGTPTFLSLAEIEELYTGLTDNFTISPTAEIGIEVEPRSTSSEQCDLLRRLGFNRISMGVQDFDPVVQERVRRVQSYEMTRKLFDRCRDLGFESINIDLIYGLPHQTSESFSKTIERVIEMSPDRIALFSYAHVPWLKKQQGSFERYLPEPAEKFRIFCMAIERLCDAGYRYIGMDHFVRPDDELARAQDERTLHRNFQGYTTRAGCDLYGFGVSAIGAFEDLYYQNHRTLDDYRTAIETDGIATMRGVRLDAEDHLRRSVINRILCHCTLPFAEVERDFSIDFHEHFGQELTALETLAADGLVNITENSIDVAPAGRIFIRAVAAVFDEYLNRPVAPTHPPRFSNTL